MATVPKPPMIKYRLDFGKALGGSLAPAAVTPVVNYFMKEIINKMLVWPQRIVVPILYVGPAAMARRLCLCLVLASCGVLAGWQPSMRTVWS